MFSIASNGLLCDVSVVEPCTAVPVFYATLNYGVYLQDNYNALHIAAMHSREDIVKILLTKKGVDPFASGGVSS